VGIRNGLAEPISFYSGCQKNVPIAERFFATTLMPPSFFRNINMTSGIISISSDPLNAVLAKRRPPGDREVISLGRSSYQKSTLWFFQ
jgi:hypothetical protein